MIEVAYAPALPVVAPCLDADEARRLAALRDAEARLAFEQAHSLKRRLLSRRHPGVEPGAWRFGCDARGKPSLAGASVPGLHFNLSHARRAVAVAFASCPVGVDTERHRPCNRDRIAAGLFHARERRWIEGCVDREVAFFRLWTLKEALVKASGRGLTRAMAEVAWEGLEGDRCEARWDGRRWMGFSRCEGGLSTSVVVPMDAGTGAPRWERVEAVAAAGD